MRAVDVETLSPGRSRHAKGTEESQKGWTLKKKVDSGTRRAGRGTIV